MSLLVWIGFPLALGVAFCAPPPKHESRRFCLFAGFCVGLVFIGACTWVYAILVEVGAA